MKKVLVILMFVMLIVPFNLLAQEDLYQLFYLPFFTFEPEIVDAKGAAMGRTTVLTTSGSNAIFTNPASLGMVEERVLQGGMRFFFGSEKTKYEQEGVDDYEASYLFHMKFNHASFAIPHQIEDSPVKTTFAVGYRTYYDLGFTFYEEDKDQDYEITRKLHGGLNTLTFGGALNYEDKFLAGLAINIGIMGKGSWEEKEKESGNTEKRDGDITLKGSFFILGGIYKVSPRMTIGLMYRPGFELNCEGEDEFGNTDDVDITIPGLFAVSGEYALSEGFDIVFEYQSRGLGDYEVENEDIYDDSENGSSIRLGSEIGVVIPFRLGFYMNSVPLYDRKSDGTVDESPNSLIGFTGGISLPLSPQTDLDLFGEYAFVGREDKWYESTSDANRIKFGFTFTYRMK
jgi:hypothetical protein